MSVRTSPVVAVVAALVGLAAAIPVAAAEAEPAPVPISVPIAATATGGPTGIALLAATDQGTGVQVLVSGAPAGTNVSIHGQACGAIDGSALVGLVGELAVNGQTQAIIPAPPLATLADGNHVIALHPGLDFTGVIACGAIPRTAVGPRPQPQPPVNDTCAGVPAWVTSARARLARITEMETLANTAQLRGISVYLTQLAANVGETRAMANLARAEQAPAGAADAHAAFIDMLDSLAKAADALSIAMSGQDYLAVQHALADLNAANQKLVQVRTTVTELAVRCLG